ncbi:LLM class flavin-dependent oxidoreductase [Arthrobacter zhaoguopingii]|uniref:LLM class flavin-dependent oxidoreductase n=1 Tax=Arthrobacter zhaoguopingii TaxID=2681491 RepID=UPI00135A47CC|nr:LLM class flavin-dependent oxidoreductase [Arthrobacter zhaoguopingii]
MQAEPRRRMLLGAYITYAYGHHPAAWRHPGSEGAAPSSLSHYAALASTAEEGLLDFLFLADTPSVFNDERHGRSARVVGLEPLTLLSALAPLTRDIGLLATVSTSFSEPYNVARQFASLDHLSGGRAGWNIVTSSKEAAAASFGRPGLPAHAERYARAEEFVEVVCALWESWHPDAFVRDRETGRYYRPEARRPVSFHGRHVSAFGELNVEPPPQGRPVLVQAGASGPGLRLGARWADLIFTSASDLTKARHYKSALDAAMRQVGRKVPGPLVLPGVSIYGAETLAAAERRFAELNDLVHPEHALSMLSDQLGTDVTGFPSNQPLPTELPLSNGNLSKRAHILEIVRDEPNLTLEALSRRIAAARSHLVLIGSWDSVTDTLVEWFQSGVCDGFNLMPPVLPFDLEGVVAEIVPRLQRRGVFATSSPDGPLRRRLLTSLTNTSALTNTSL